MIKTLKSVWLDDNEFETFPNALCALPQLQCIRMSKNSLKEVPESISTITSLEILALDNNAIDVVSAGVYRLSALKQLWLRQNRIAELPAGIDGLRALEVLSLSSNLLTSITEELVKLPSLKKLYLNGNRIEKIPAALLLALSSTSLQVLNIANNFIETLPEEWYEQVNGSVSKVADIKIGSITVTIVGNPLQRP